MARERAARASPTRTLRPAGAVLIRNMESNPENSMTSSTENSVSPPSRKRQKTLYNIQTFAAQCVKCEKWRLIEIKKKYEEIRSRIQEDPFICEKAREWKSDVSCDDPSDISQEDGSKLWAIDKPNIPQSPPSWERFVKIRSEGSTQFADVLYKPPTGKMLRSLKEVKKYLAEHPAQGVEPSQFSFEAPAPLQKDYVIKRSQKSQSDVSHTGILQPEEVQPISWAAPSENNNIYSEDQPEVAQSELLEPMKPESPPPALAV